MQERAPFSFTRYLSAKKSVDDRALNRHVWDAFKTELRLQPDDGRHILEIGAGIGTMIERIIDWNLLDGDAHITAIDASAENIAAARERLAAFCARRGIGWREGAGGEIEIRPPDRRIALTLEAADLEHWAKSAPQSWDALITHAVLDLLDVPTTVPLLRALLGEGGLMYLTINFDGATIFEPEFDPAFDRLVEELYHRTMDERRVDGHPSGDRHTGRHLFRHLRANRIEVLAAGSSDWVVHPGPEGYVEDEAYFLHCVIDMLDGALRDHPDLDQVRFAEWIAARRAQIERAELVYIAHQLDLLARR